VIIPGGFPPEKTAIAADFVEFCLLLDTAEREGINWFGAMVGRGEAEWDRFQALPTAARLLVRMWPRTRTESNRDLCVLHHDHDRAIATLQRTKNGWVVAMIQWNPLIPTLDHLARKLDWLP